MIAIGKPPRTVVASASYEARAFGVHADMPFLKPGGGVLGSGDPLNSGKEIYRLALRIWDFIGGERPVRLLGVTVSNLQRPSNQLSLFSRPNRLGAVWEAIDRVNDKYGDFTHTWGSLHQSPRRLQPGFP